MRHSVFRFQIRKKAARRVRSHGKRLEGQPAVRDFLKDFARLVRVQRSAALDDGVYLACAFLEETAFAPDKCFCLAISNIVCLDHAAAYRVTDTAFKAHTLRDNAFFAFRHLPQRINKARAIDQSCRSPDCLTRLRALADTEAAFLPHVVSDQDCRARLNG